MGTRKRIIHIKTYAIRPENSPVSPDNDHYCDSKTEAGTDSGLMGADNQGEEAQNKGPEPPEFINYRPIWTNWPKNGR